MNTNEPIVLAAELLKKLAADARLKATMLMVSYLNINGYKLRKSFRRVVAEHIYNLFEADQIEIKTALSKSNRLIQQFEVELTDLENELEQRTSIIEPTVQNDTPPFTVNPNDIDELFNRINNQ